MELDSTHQRAIFGVILRFIIGFIVALIGGPIWLLLIVQIFVEYHKARQDKASLYPVIDVVAAMGGWLAGFLFSDSSFGQPI